MSLTKNNFDMEFMNQTVGNADFKELRDLQEMQQQWEKGLFRKLPDCISHLNGIKGVGLKVRKPDVESKYANDLMIIKGRFQGMIYTKENRTLKTLQSIIESYGFKIEAVFFLEESDEKFTNLSFTIKE